MKVGFITTSISRYSGGLFVSVRRLAQNLAKLPDVDAEVFALQDFYAIEDAAKWEPISPRLFPTRGPAAFPFSFEMVSQLLLNELDVLHTQGIWQYPSIACLRWSRRQNHRYMVSPRGMLDPWALGRSAWKKRLAGWLFENQHLAQAACVHALTAAEAIAFRQYGLRNPICVVPNAIDVPDLSDTECGRDGHVLSSMRRRGQQILLYLGRLHPKKGLRNLIHAWSLVQERDSALGGSGGQLHDWVLAIAGWDQAGHEAELRHSATQAGIAARVLFLGPQFGAGKHACLAACDAFIVPSLSEGMPMSVLEAWSYAKPVLMTPQCNIPEGFTEQAALMIEPTVNSIRGGIERLAAMSNEERKGMGTRGRQLVETRFNWPRVSESMMEVYRWILGGGPRPDCVRLY